MAKGKRERKPKVSSKKSAKYKIEGGKLVRGRTCPKCGSGVFLAEHKDRYTCGRCAYTEKK